jgi:hypothetical protein
VSHYTTTYVAITLLGLTLAFQWATSWFRPVRRVSAGMAVAFIAAAAGAAIYYGPVTQSAGNVTQFVQAAQAQGFDLLPNRVPAGGLLAAYLQGNTATPMSPQQYARLVRADYAANRPYVHPLRDAGRPQYALRDSAAPSPPVEWNLGYNTLLQGGVVAQQLIYLLAAAGALILVLRRTVPVIARQIGLLTLAALFFLVTARLSGTLATFYNAERALLQTMVFLDIALCWCLQEFASRWRVRQAGALVLASAVALLVVIFINSSGLVGAVLGGGTATNLANSGTDFEQFDMTSPELASASWLGAKVPRGQLVYADRYGQLPLIAVTGMSSGLMLDLTPQTLDRNAWVYASRTNVIDGRARAYYSNHSITYAFPSRFLDANYNLVYTNGSSEVYHR